jgi:hypothetical protein
MTRRSLSAALTAAVPALTAAVPALTPALAFAQAQAQPQGDGGEPNYLVVFGGMALGVIVVALVLATVARVQKARYETIRAMVEKGQEIPEQLLGHRHHHFPREPQAQTPEYLMGHALGWGVLLSFLGLGVGLANFLSSGEIRSAAWGLIFLFLGLGMLTNSAIIRAGIRRRQRNDGGR